MQKSFSVVFLQYTPELLSKLPPVMPIPLQSSTSITIFKHMHICTSFLSRQLLLISQDPALVLPLLG